MKTIKLPYFTDSEIIGSLQKEQNRIVGKIYQFIKQQRTQKEITQYTNSLDSSLDSWFLQSALYEAKAMIKADKELFKIRLAEWEENKSKRKPKLYRLFGGKKNRLLYDSKQITKDEYKQNKLFPLISIGQALSKGNRKFKIDLDNNKIIFKVNRNNHILLSLPKLRNNKQKELRILEELQNNKSVPITYKLDQHFIYISYEEQCIEKINGINHAGIDLNPNYIGFTINNKNNETVYSRLYKIKDLVDADKQRYELSIIAKQIIKLCQHYKVKNFTIEKLSIKSKNHNKGKTYNKNVNNKWNRKDFTHFIRSRCKIYGIGFKEVNPAYSSIIGNLLYNNLIDACASAKEISRRGISDQFYPALPDTNEINPLLADLLSKCQTWKEIGQKLKNSKMRYRISAEKAVFQSFISCKSLVYTAKGFV